MLGRRRPPAGDPVPVLLAERAGHVLGERVAVALAVGGAHERADDLDVPLRDLARLAPEVGQAEVDVELEEIDATRALGHVPRVGRGSDGIPHLLLVSACGDWYGRRPLLRQGMCRLRKGEAMKAPFSPVSRSSRASWRSWPARRPATAAGSSS